MIAPGLPGTEGFPETHDLPYSTVLASPAFFLFYVLNDTPFILTFLFLPTLVWNRQE